MRRATSAAANYKKAIRWTEYELVEARGRFFLWRDGTGGSTQTERR